MVLDLLGGISPTVVLLKLMGHWPTPRHENLYKVYSILMVTNMYLYNITSVMYLMKNYDNTEEVTATVYNLLSTIAVVIKAQILQKNHGHLKNIVKMLELPELQPTNSKQEKILTSGIFWAKALLYYFCVLATFALGMWVLAPVLANEARLPTNAWFPHSEDYYTEIYIWQGVMITCLAFSNVGMDTLFAVLMMGVGGQCDTLYDEVSNLKNSENASKNLHQCIERHKLILTYNFELDFILVIIQDFRLADTIGIVFGKLVFMQFATTVVTLCETMFLVSLLTKFNATFVGLVLYQGAAFTQIFLYCWFGNEVIVKSEKLRYSCFECGWYDCSEPFKKDLLFFMMRLEKPIILYVGNMFPISVMTFTSILRSSWAYFMALRTVHDKE